MQYYCLSERLFCLAGVNEAGRHRLPIREPEHGEGLQTAMAVTPLSCSPQGKQKPMIPVRVLAVLDRLVSNPFPQGGFPPPKIPPKMIDFGKPPIPYSPECGLNARKVGLHEFFWWGVYCPSGRGVIGHCAAF